MSTVIPVYNRERYLGEAIESVLDQEVPGLEIIVVDDGSSDGSHALAGRYPSVRCIRRRNGGIAAARNTGIRCASGRFLAFLDSDDRWPRGRLAVQLRFLHGHETVDAVLGQVSHYVSPELPAREKAAIHCPIGSKPGLLCGAMLARRHAFDQVGLFDEELRVGEFVDWYVRAEEAGLKLQMLPIPALLRRLHGRDQATARRDSHADYLRVVRRRLARARAAGRSEA